MREGGRQNDQPLMFGVDEGKGESLGEPTDVRLGSLWRQPIPVR